MIAFVLAACLAQTDWGDFHPRRALTEDELSQAGEILARRLRSNGVEELAELASTLAVRQGESAPFVFVEIATIDARGNPVTRPSTWTRHVGEWAVQRPAEGWIELDGNRLAEALAGVPDEALRGHVLALARKDREAVARARGQTVRLAAVPCRWVEYEADGACYEALLAGDAVLESWSPAERWAEERIAEAERRLSAGQIDGAYNAVRRVLAARPEDRGASELLDRIEAQRRQVLAGHATSHPDDDYDLVGSMRVLGIGVAVVSLLLIVLLLARRSRAATP